MRTKVFKEFQYLLIGDFHNKDIENKVWQSCIHVSNETREMMKSSNVYISEILSKNWEYYSFLLKSILTNYILRPNELPLNSLIKAIKSTTLLLLDFNLLLDEDVLIKLILNKFTEWSKFIYENYSPDELKTKPVYFLIQPELANFPFECINWQVDAVNSKIASEGNLWWVYYFRSNVEL